jgi:hypothetical protein
MRRRVITTAIGVAAAGALLVGNGTFAAWTDSPIDVGNRVGSSKLELTLTRPGTQPVDITNLLPGGTAAFQSFVTSRDREAVPLADLALRIQDLVDAGDVCTTSSEAEADDCESGPAGDFSGTAYVTVSTSLPTTDPAACESALHPRASVLPDGIGTLRDLADFGALNLLRDGADADSLPDWLTPGEGICVVLAIGLPASAGNALQGDSVSFDARFELSQHA